MSLDINEDDSVKQGGDFYYEVFREGVRVRQPLKDTETKLYIMPAFGDPTDPTSWISFRNPSSPLDDNGNHRFTAWIRRYYAYQFVGKKGHFLAPKTFDPSAPDPIGRLVDVAKRDPRYYDICGLGADGKKNKEDSEAYQRVLLQQAEELYAINAVCTNPAKEEDAGISCIYSLKKTMVKGKFDVKETGLLYNLSLKNRAVDGNVDPSDFSRFYYWGDVTDVKALVPCKISKIQVKGASGQKSFPYFNMTPVEGTPIKCTKKMLETRQFLDDTFKSDLDPSETIEKLVDIFSDYPDLLRKAFEAQYPGVNNMLRECGVVSNSRVHVSRSEEDEEYSPGRDRQSANVRSEEPQAPAGRTFAPKAASLEPEPAEEELPEASNSTKTSGTAKSASNSSTIGTSDHIKEAADKIRQQLESDGE